MERCCTPEEEEEEKKEEEKEVLGLELELRGRTGGNGVEGGGRGREGRGGGIREEKGICFFLSLKRLRKFSLWRENEV